MVNETEAYFELILSIIEKMERNGFKVTWHLDREQIGGWKNGHHDLYSFEYDYWIGPTNSQTQKTRACYNPLEAFSECVVAYKRYKNFVDDLYDKYNPTYHGIVYDKPY